MKARCKVCNRLVGTTKDQSEDTRRASKHRTGRSTSKKVKPVCKGSRLPIVCPAN